LAEETEQLGENLLQHNFVHHKFHMNSPGIEHKPPATNLLYYGAADKTLAQKSLIRIFSTTAYIIHKRKKKSKAIPVTGPEGP
jgi:hypothetical protein